MNKSKMAQFSKFKVLFEFKLIFNGNQFYSEISILGYIKMPEKTEQIWKKIVFI